MKIKKWFILPILYFVVLTMCSSVNTFAAAEPIFDVSVSQINIRSGAGTNYSIIGTEPKGADMPCYYPYSQSTANGYTWVRFYYPVSSVGEYRTSINGWAVWFQGSTHTDESEFTDYCAWGGKVTASTLYTYTNPQLSTRAPYTHSSGTTIFAYDTSRNSMCYERNYPNAWRIYEDNPTVYYANGWYINANPKN